MWAGGVGEPAAGGLVGRVLEGVAQVSGAAAPDPALELDLEAIGFGVTDVPVLEERIHRIQGEVDQPVHVVVEQRDAAEQAAAEPLLPDGLHGLSPLGTEPGLSL